MLSKTESKNNNKQIKHSNGFFIEAGAGDGEIVSNSLYFEIKYQVRLSADSGLLIIFRYRYHEFHKI